MKPILFSTPMIQAILAGQKTMTRRVMKPTVNGGDPVPFTRCAMGCFDINRHGECFNFYDKQGHYVGAAKQLLFHGDILWVRETHYRYGHWLENGFSESGKQKWTFAPDSDEVLFFDNKPEKLGKKSEQEKPAWWCRPSIYMPASAARIFLRVTGVRAERLQDITEEDACAEGCDALATKIGDGKFEDVLESFMTAKDAFIELWDSLSNLRGNGWDTNPWVWVYEFERISKEEAER